MSTYELIDELEAGELSVSTRAKSPGAARVGDRGVQPRIASRRSRPTTSRSSTWRTRSIRRCASSPSTPGRLPLETHQLIDQLRQYHGLNLHVPQPDPAQVERLISIKGLEPDERVGREPVALLQRAQGSAAHEATRRARRLGHRPAARPVGDPHEHPQGRDRPRPRRDREAEPARGVDEARGVGVPGRERRPVHGLYAQGYTSIGCAPCTRAIGPMRTIAPAAGGGSRTRRRSAACTARSSTVASSTS